nr:putative Ig domain-containing protein [Chryseolinea lacunae]
MNENQELNFRVKTRPEVKARFSIEGTEGLGIQFDSLGNFSWKPSFDLVDRVAKTKDISLIFQAAQPDGKRERKTISFIVKHVNRPPVAEELPVLYVKQGKENSYQISADYVYDEDGDPMSFRSPQTQLPEGAALSSQGQFTWTPSRTQFANLKNNPLTIEFIAQDQPDKAETKGKLRIAQTQLDLPSEIQILPIDTLFSIKEDETLNLKIYISDPNGDDNVRSAGFIASDKRIPAASFKENTQLLYEFTWTPGYEFVDDAQTSLTPEITFFVLDKSNNRTQKKVKIKVADTENMIKKDAHLFSKYRGNLIDAIVLLQQIDANQKKLNQDYKKAKKGKKNRSIVNASLGAVTGFTPIIVDDPNSAKAVSGVGGTTVLTLGTLEATEVIGRSKENILEKIKISIDLRNKIQSTGDDFARKYALKVNRRSPEFDKDIEKMRAALNDQRIVLLELDAYNKNVNKIDDKDIRRVFLDYGDETK